MRSKGKCSRESGEEKDVQENWDGGKREEGRGEDMGRGSGKRGRQSIGKTVELE